MDDSTLQTFESSLARCTGRPDFLDLFYETFLASSPKVREKFANTEFANQKRMLSASFNLMLRAAQNEESGLPEYLEGLAIRHGAKHLAIGADLYDLWLDSLLVAVRASDPDCTPGVEKAWEAVMGIGIKYLCSHYNS
jgi:hemoglobin-like flavoprotein